MGVPSSGQLRLRGDIALEVDGNVTGTNVSLHTLAISAGFTSPDAMREFYGYVDAVVPTVTSSNNSSVGTTSMTANGNVTSDGDASITERGFYFGTSSTYTSNTKYSVAGTTGGFSRGFSGLSSGATHYATAYAINSVGETVATTRSSNTLNTRALSITRTYTPSGTSGSNSRSALYNVTYTGGGGATVYANQGFGPYNAFALVSFTQNSGNSSFGISGNSNGIWATWQSAIAVDVQAQGRFTLSVPSSSTSEGKSLTIGATGTGYVSN